MGLFTIFLVLFHHSKSKEHLFPIEASWFADRFTENEWTSELQRFNGIGGHIIWQRGRIFRTISADDLHQDFNFQWCWIDGIHCVIKYEQLATQHDLDIQNFLLYDYEENYNKYITKCPLDTIVYSSRVYHILVLPHDELQDDPCDVQGKKVDILMTYFTGIDSKELMFSAASKLGVDNFEIYLGPPYLPVKVNQPWAIDVSIMPAFYEFTKRVFNMYVNKYERYGDLFAGTYQAMETGMSGSSLSTDLLKAYEILAAMTHDVLKGRKFVLSPYVDGFKDQVANTSVEQHVRNFEILAKIADVMAIQEGRGCGKNAFFEKFQEDVEIHKIDEKLEKIVHYLEKTPSVNPTFKEKYHFSGRDLFRGFADAIERLKPQYTPEFWLNVEAFEYLRDFPCLPVDKIGNGMAELLDRTSKRRIDFSLTSESFFVSKIITFAWDYDYHCVPNESEYTKSLYQEIYDDFDRPIINEVSLANDTKMIDLFGFNIAFYECEFIFRSVTKENGQDVKLKPVHVDPKWGEKNNKSYLLGRSVVKNELKGDNVFSVFAQCFGKENFHPVYLYSEKK